MRPDSLLCPPGSYVSLAGMSCWYCLQYVFADPQLLPRRLLYRTASEGFVMTCRNLWKDSRQSDFGQAEAPISTCGQREWRSFTLRRWTRLVWDIPELQVDTPVVLPRESGRRPGTRRVSVHTLGDTVCVQVSKLVIMIRSLTSGKGRAQASMCSHAGMLTLLCMTSGWSGMLERLFVYHGIPHFDSRCTGEITNQGW
jgi:hypothetical protein